MSVVEAIARLNRLMQRIRQRQPRVRVALDVWTPRAPAPLEFQPARRRGNDDG